MWSAVVIGLLTGFILAIPPGPLAVAVIKKGLEGSYRAGFGVIAASVFMDSVFALLATFASSALVVAIADALTSNGWLTVGFQLVCVVVLLILGIRYLKHRHVTEETFERREKTQEERARKLGSTSPFLLGIIVATTNLALPTFMPSLIGVVSFLTAHHLFVPEAGNQFLFSLGYGMGTGTWLTVLLHVLLRHRGKMSDNLLTGIFRFAGGTFLVFAAAMTITVAITTDWTSLLLR